MKILRKRYHPVAATPGTLVVQDEAPKPRIRMIDYDESHIDEREISDVDELRQILERTSTTWVDIQGLGEEKTLRSIGAIFSLHPLILEEVVNVPQRPKIEELEGNVLFITRMIHSSGEVEIDREQVSIVVGRNYVLTIQERYGDNLDSVRKRLRRGRGPIRQAGPDYLAYVILDAMIDGYFPVLEKLGDSLEILEERVMEDPAPSILRKLNRARNTLLVLRRAIWPQRDALSLLVRGGSELVGEETLPYFRDIHDHCVLTAEVTEAYREQAAGLVNTYLSAASQRTNEIMKVLTIMASIFIPLTFLAGIYGMNFDHMPEIHRPWAYPALLGVMALVTAGMLLHFRRRGWIGGKAKDEGKELDAVKNQEP